MLVAGAGRWPDWSVMLAASAGRWRVVCCVCGGCRKVAGGLLCLWQVQEGGRWSVCLRQVQVGDWWSFVFVAGSGRWLVAAGAGRWLVV